MPAQSEARLAALPWGALAGLAPALEEPLRDVLAGTPADRAVDRFLRRHRAFTADQRQAAAEALFGVALWRLRLRWSVADTAPPLYLLAALLRDLAGRPDAEPLAGLAPGTLPPPRTDAPPPDVRFSIPPWLWEILAREAPDDALALADALNLPGPIYLRANTALTSRDALAARLATEGLATRPGVLAPTCLVVTSPRPNLWGSAAWQDGLFEVQDEGSQVLCTLVEAQPGDEVLDLCAGAGGKSLALAAAVGPRGRVHATDPDLGKLDRLRTRAQRARLGNLVLHGAAPPPDLKVPRVLVDAPCSELGALRRGPDLRHRLDPATFAALPGLQRALLELARAHLAPKGRLVYATCTLRREENEAVADAFAAAHPELERARADLRLWPHRDGTDGFYAAVFTLTRP